MITRREMLDRTMSACQDSWEDAEYIEIRVYDGIPLGPPPKREDCMSEKDFEFDMHDYLNHSPHYRIDRWPWATSMSDVEKELDREFNDGYGTQCGAPFRLVTKKCIYTDYQYDGQDGIDLQFRGVSPNEHSLHF